MIPYRDYPDVKTIYDKVTPLFLENFLATEPIVVNQGGSSSAKTFNILKVLAQRLIDYDGTLCTVTGQDIPNLKDGSYTDFNVIVGENKRLQYAIEKQNKTEREFHFRNGSKIQFKAYGDWQDAKNGKRDFLFVNEANGIDYAIYEELQLRTRYQTFIDYNPNSEFWVHERVIGQPDVKFIKSTWIDNPLIPERIRTKILGYKDTDPYRWQVYGLGELGLLEGLIFPDWQEVDDIPQEYDWKVTGLDFGYFNSPTALIDVYKSGNNLYFDEIVYQKDLLLKDLAHVMLKYPSDHMFVGDSAEPKLIASLRREGLSVAAAKKGPDSIRIGIDKLKEHNCFYTSRSANIRKEKQNYVWQVVDGRPTNKPIDDYNHAIDAIRYSVFTGVFSL